MSFVLTAVCSGCRGFSIPRTSGLVLEVADQGPGAETRAGYIRGLERHLGSEVVGVPIHVFGPGNPSYLTSNELFYVPEEDDQPAKLSIPARFRGVFDDILEQLLEQSPVGRAILIAEYNGSVTDPDSDECHVDIFGPWTRDGFWLHHDLGEVVEEAIVLLKSDV